MMLGQLVALLALMLTWISPGANENSSGIGSTDERERRPCVECHRGIVRAFASTRMAQAASSAEFLQEWRENKQPAYCMSCHSPGSGPGLVCSDCHGDGPHPYSKVPVPQVCARCHDAPGENTVRRFLESAAARSGKLCLDCHLVDTAAGADHSFAGPSLPGFLNNRASIQLFLRSDPGPTRTAVIRVTHQAGHALPGGTTGRSVWLVVKGMGADDREAWREELRFGWYHHPERGWLDHTLPPDRPVLLELPAVDRNGAEHLEAQLIYRFRPGPLNAPDPNAVLLDQAEIAIPNLR